MTFLFLFLFTVIQVHIIAQETISGKVIDNYGAPIMVANVYIGDTYDGTATNEEGVLHF